PNDDGTATARAHLFLRCGRFLMCREVRTGLIRWSSRLAGHPLWVGVYADTVVAGTERSIHALRRDDGDHLWEWDAAEGGLSAFRLSAGRLFFLHGPGRLFALDIRTGALLWGRAAPGARLQFRGAGGAFGEAFHAGREW